MGAYEDAVISNYHIAYKEYVEYKETHIGLHTQEERDKALELERRCNYWKAEYNKNECYKITGQTAYEFEGSAIDECHEERREQQRIQEAVKYKKDHCEQFDISYQYKGAVEKRVELEEQKAAYMKNHSDLQGKRDYVEQLEKYDEQISKAFEDEMFMDKLYRSHNCQEVNGGMDGPRFSNIVGEEHRKKIRENYAKDEKSQKAQELLDSFENSNDKENSYS